MLGETVSHYRILSRLGHGGMGVVYTAEDTHLGRKVAIKFSNARHETSQFRARFLREARSASALNHPNIAEVYDYGEGPDGEPFLVMELVPGENLHEHLRGGPLSMMQACRVAEQVADALGEAHRHGIVHRDIKPSNIVINDRGQVKVLDFGLAKCYETQAPAVEEADPTITSIETTEGIVLGTPQYMSPEQAGNGEVGPQSDLFSLGAVLYECLTGRSAFTGANSITILAAVIHVEPPPPSALNASVPGKLDRICLKALRKNPEERYQTAADMAADLRAARHALADTATQETELLPRSARNGAAPASSALATLRTLAGPLRRSRTMTLAATALIAAAAVIGWLVLSPGTYQPSPNALRWYQAGVAALRDGTYYKASKALEQAVKQDSAFAMAHARLAEAWLELEYIDRANQEMLRAAPAGTHPRLARADEQYVQAMNLTLTGDFGQAAAKFRQIAREAPEEAKADADVDLGRAYEKSGNPREALAAYQEAVQTQRQNPAAWLRLGILYGRQTDQPKAAQAFDQAEQLYRTLSNMEGVTETSYQRGVLATRVGRTEDARHALQQALELARNTGSPSQLIQIFLQLSGLELHINKLAECQADATQAIELARAEGLESLASSGLIALGNAYFLRSEYDQAEKYFEQGLTYARLHRSERTEARALLSLGSLAFQTGRTSDAQSYTRQALTWYERRGYQKETATALILLSRVERRKGDLPAAQASLEDQLKVAQKLGDMAQVALAQQGLAIVMEGQGRWPEALAKYREGYQTALQSHDHQNALYSLLDAGIILWQLGRYDEARQSLDQIGPDAPPAALALAGNARAAMARSQRLFPAALAASRQVLTQPGLGGEALVHAKENLGLAELASGLARDGAVSIAESVALAEKANDPWLIADTGLANAAASLAAGNPRQALEDALAAQRWYSRASNLPFEWQCWLLAARAESALGEAPKSREYAVNASQLLADLGRKWDSESYQSYLARPDIQYDRGQLSRLSAAK